MPKKLIYDDTKKQVNQSGHHPTQCNHVHFGDSVANDRKGILADLTIGRDIVGGVDVTVIDDRTTFAALQKETPDITQSVA